MVEYKLKYEGEKIDELLEAVDNGSVVTSNTDSVIESGNEKPVSSDAIHRALDKKVDKILGYGLSEWSYSSADRDAVATVKDGSIITDNTVSSLIKDGVKPISSGAMQKLWRDKGYTFEGVRIDGSGTYDVYIGGSGGSKYIVSSNAKVEIPLDGTSVTFNGEATITASMSRYQDESTGSYRGTLTVRVSGNLPLYNTFFAESLTPIMDALIPHTVLRKDEVLDNISAGSTLPVQSHAIRMALNEKVDKESGKGLSTIDYDYEEQAKVTKNTSDIATNAAKIAEQGTMLAKHSEDIAKKANTTEYYPSMAVGVADNLRGRGEATEEEFTYRPSAGASNSISEEGVATMKRIKGNSVVWNNLIERMNNPERDGLSFTYENGILNITGVAQAQWYPSLFSTPIQNSDHTFLLRVKKIDGQYTKASQGTRPLWICNGTDGWGGHADGDDNYKILEGISYKDLGLTCNIGDAFDNCRLVIEYHDLTLMFGAGNEPTTLEDFYVHIPAGIDINAYNKGQLISMNANAIKTTGFNQWNEKWERGVYHIWEGGSGKKLNGGNYEDYIRSADYIDVLPSTIYCISLPNDLYVTVGGFDKNNVFIRRIDYDKHTNSYALITTPRNCTKIAFYTKTIEYNNDICFNLSHSGVRDGEYEPYEEHTQDLPEIVRYFPDGMKSVGGVFDEINEHEAVQRVGQRAYTEGDNDNPVVMTDGVNTVYPLDKPIVTPMPARAINLNYPVWDWGTERAVSDAPYAPFRADIIYGFNAVDTIRTNKLNIEDILRRLAELEAKTVVEQSVEE